MDETGFRKRVQIDFEKHDYEMLLQMKKDGNLTTLSGVVRRAIKRYCDYLHFRKQGFRPFMRNEKGEEVQLPEDVL